MSSVISTCMNWEWGGGGVGEKHELPYYLEFPKYNIFDQNYVKEKMICHLFIK